MLANYYLICTILLLSIHQSLQWSIPRVISVEHGESLPLLNFSGKDIVAMTCSSTGDPKPTLRWTFNGTEIQNDDQHRISSGNSRLTVYSVKMHNAGVYRCYAKNDYGTTFGELLLRVATIGDFDKGFKSTVALKTVQAKLGAPFKIPCPKHTEGRGQIYFWGVIKPHQAPIIWDTGSPLSHMFVGEHGAISFAFLKQSDVEKINKLGGISCILYNEKESHQSVKYKIEYGEDITNQTFPTKLVSYMDEEFVGVENTIKNIVCGATGRPVPKISWYKDGTLIYDADKGFVDGAADNFRISDGSMKLDILRVKKTDAGIYKCLAKNRLASDEKEGRLIVHHGASFKKELPGKISFNYHSPMVLTCVADGFPAVSYTWYHNGTIITSNTERKISNGTLTILLPEFQHSGVYMCLATNYLRTTVSPGFVSIEPVLPSFGKMPENPTYFFKREVNSLYCNATGGPAPLKTWYRNNIKIETKDHFTVHSNSTVVVSNAAETDGGKYKCEAINVKGAKESVTTVKVVERTVINKPPAERTAVEGMPLLQLFCDAIYEKKLNVNFEWMKNGAPLQFDERVYKERRNKGIARIIFFKYLKLSDAANYTCRVYTTDGPRTVSEDQKVGKIIIIAKPLKPTNVKISGDCSSMKNVNLTWTASVATGAPVQYYIIEYASASSKDKWYTYDPDSEQTSHTSTELLKANLPAATADLVFRVTAVSMYKGDKLISPPSKSTASGACLPPGGPPILNPNNVRSNIEGDGKLTITWDPLDKMHKPGPDYKIVVGYRKVTKPPSEFVNATLPGDQTSFVVPDPGSNEKYEVFVQAKNKYGSGPKSKIEVMTSGDKAITSAVKNVKVVSTSSTHVVLSWDEVERATGYRIYYRVDSASIRKRRESPGTDYKDVTTKDGGNVTGLQPNKDYKVAVAALNANGAGPKSQEVSFKTDIGVPGIPTNVKLNILGSGLHLSWTPPSDKNGDVTSYTVRWYKTDEPAVKHTMTLDGDAQEAFITKNLDPLSYYTVELVANTDAGKGKSWVMDGIVVGDPDSPGKPGKPIVYAVNGSILNVTFTLPANYMGDIPNKFRVFYYKKESDNPVVKNVSQAYPDKAWLELDKLEYTRYIIWTAGENSLGVSGKSEKVEGTPSEPIVVPAKESSDDPFYAKIWFIILICLIILLIIIILLIYCCCNRRGGKYPVGEKEKDRGGWDSQPLKDYADLPMDEVNGDAIKNHKEPVRSASQNSIQKEPLSDDEGSLDDYGEDTKFNEDGSFIGQYGDDDKKPLKV